MATKLNLTAEQYAQATRNIANFLAFTREVLENPSILDNVPNGTEVHVIPKAERDPACQYDVEATNMVTMMTPARQPQPGRRTGSRRRVIPE